MSFADRALVEAAIAHLVRMRDDPDCGEEPYGDDHALCRVYLKEDKCFACPRPGTVHCDRPRLTNLQWCWIEYRRGTLGNLANDDCITVWRRVVDMEIDRLQPLLD